MVVMVSSNASSRFQRLSGLRIGRILFVRIGGNLGYYRAADRQAVGVEGDADTRPGRVEDRDRRGTRDPPAPTSLSWVAFLSAAIPSLGSGRNHLRLCLCLQVSWTCPGGTPTSLTSMSVCRLERRIR